MECSLLIASMPVMASRSLGNPRRIPEQPSWPRLPNSAMDRFAGDIVGRIVSTERVARLISGELATTAISLSTLICYLRWSLAVDPGPPRGPPPDRRRLAERPAPSWRYLQ